DALDDIRANQVGNTATYLNTFSYDPTTWHLTAIAGHVNWALSYDANGNVISKGAGNDAYAFDAANRLTAVAGKESYRYDGYGRRVKITRSTDGKIDYPVYDLGGQLLTEDDQRSNQTTDYVSLNGSLVAKRASAIGKNQWTTTYEHTDALRSPRDETSASGALTRAELYTPYGEPGDGKYVQGPGYTGHVTDAATHLTYAQQRYYDPVMGRFLSTDPVQADDKGGDFNRYWYANNNPYRFTDPDGRDPQEQDIFHVVGKAIATDVAYGVGVVTGNEALKNAAVDGWTENVGWKNAAIAVIALDTGGKEGEPISMDMAVSRGVAHVGPEGTAIVTKGGNVQFTSTKRTDSGDLVTKNARFDVNPSNQHVKNSGPHLNLETHVNGKSIQNEHVPIQPNTVKSGDYAPTVGTHISNVTPAAPIESD
ncbi:MAG: RHS repeat-associated core domain-containing protein, partial [Proteobacteria bacterium]|nr:RHS repeat-associated core domain-containing protein [Pseudomonadota bacterium]